MTFLAPKNRLGTHLAGCEATGRRLSEHFSILAHFQSFVEILFLFEELEGVLLCLNGV